MRRILIGLTTGLVGLLLLVVITAYGLLHASAPQLDGKVKLTGLSASVTVTRDTLGVPGIDAHTRLDAVRALGFLHAQDRFFQMDLMRRLAAGELSELVGPAALEVDKQHRLFRLRAVAQQVVAQATPGQRADTRGLYRWRQRRPQGAGHLAVRIRLLRQRPQAWRPEDSVLVIFAMYFDLQDADDKRESDLALMRDELPAPLFRFLLAAGTQWDAPLSGQAHADAADAIGSAGGHPRMARRGFCRYRSTPHHWVRRESAATTWRWMRLTVPMAMRSSPTTCTGAVGAQHLVPGAADLSGCETSETGSSPSPA